MGGTIINHMLYVDDICIVSTFNAKKSMCMYFSIDINKHFGLSVINLGNCVCQFVKELKYLSVMIHSSIKTTIDVKRQTHFICKQIPGIALMMTSVHCFSGFCTIKYILFNISLFYNLNFKYVHMHTEKKKLKKKFQGGRPTPPNVPKLTGSGVKNTAKTNKH